METMIAREATTFEDASASSRAAAGLAEEIDSLDGVLGVLEDRLSYVLAPTGPTDSGALLSSDRVREQVSPLAERLTSHAERIGNLRDRAQRLINRLDLPA